MEKQNEANGTASEPIARYDELPILRTYKVALENIVQIGGFWAVGQDKVLYSIEMPDKVKERMWKDAKRYDIQTGKVMGYTNADRIRAMTDEELTEFMVKTIGNSFCPPSIADDSIEEVCRGKSGGCMRCWIDWLKEEAMQNDS